MWYKRGQQTKLPNGKRPRYKDLEASLIKQYGINKTLAVEVKRLTLLVAELKKDMK